ncbi:MAG TPA: DUF2089 domain-containing protein [Firmicutes bacterium]|jgi:hypothetical protein|nr:DUF2089 domain-containing protein [Bacillota bacterium]
MAHPVPGLCPVCGQKLAVSKLTCHHCETTIEGNFESCRFCGLTAEQKHFVEVFLKSRGNIKEVERELGISYPTVRGRLDNVLEAMGYRVEQEDRTEVTRQRRDILEQLSRGEIGADEAVKLLKALG